MSAAGSPTASASRSGCTRCSSCVLAVVVLVTPFSFRLINGLYRDIYPSLEASPGLLALARVALAVLALAPATILMGATLPTLTRHFAGDVSLAGAFSRLYAANTIGAIVGTVVAGLRAHRAARAVGGAGGRCGLLGCRGVGGVVACAGRGGGSGRGCDRGRHRRGAHAGLERAGERECECELARKRTRGHELAGDRRRGCNCTRGRDGDRAPHATSPPGAAEASRRSPSASRSSRVSRRSATR